MRGVRASLPRLGTLPPQDVIHDRGTRVARAAELRLELDAPGSPAGSTQAWLAGPG